MFALDIVPLHGVAQGPGDHVGISVAAQINRLHRAGKLRYGDVENIPAPDLP